MRNTREQIKNRMLKKAATLWGIPANEIEMSFDPLVALLISACAAEIEKISGEIDESQTRITEKIIQLMTPETVYGPKPAHGILSTYPIDDVVKVQSETLFYHKKKQTKKKTSQNFKNLYFTPVAPAKLIRANVNYIAVGNTIKEVKGKNDFTNLFDKSSNLTLPSSTVYFGISSDMETLDLSQISFYFELLDIDDKALFYHHLKFSEWYVGDKKLKTESGFINDVESDKLDLDAIFEDVSSKTNNIVHQTCNFYNKHFVKIKGSKKNNLVKTSNFEELDAIITKHKVKIETNVRWIKIVFPRVIANKTLSKQKICF